MPVFYTGLRGLTTVVPRRGWSLGTRDALSLAGTAFASGTPNALQGFVYASPSRILALLFDAHPLFKRARANDLSLAFGPDNTEFVAVADKLTTNDQGEVSRSEEIDGDGTAALSALWDGLTPEIGGVRGLQSAIYDHISCAGFTVVEVVPGPVGSGLAMVQTADPNTFRFEDRPEGRVLQQNQGGRWVDMDENVRAFPWDGSRDAPYGVPRASAALMDGLRDVERQAVTDDIFEQVARPRIKVGFPFYETIKFAELNPDVLKGLGKNQDGSVRDATPAEWAFLMKDKADDGMENIKYKNYLSFMIEGDLGILDGSAGLAALDPVEKSRIVRLITALLQPLSLMNMHVGGTLAYSDTEWRVHATQLEDLRAFENNILRWAANMHLRYLGLTSRCRMESKAIQTSDALKDEQTRKIFVGNELTLFDNGLQTDDDLAHHTTGSGVADPDKLAERPAGAAGETGTDDPASKSPEPADPAAGNPAGAAGK